MDYRVKVAEDVDVNSEVMRVFAYDFDDGENSRLTYSFANDTHSNFIDYFWINPKTGVVYLKQPLKGVSTQAHPTSDIFFSYWFF